MKYKLIEKGNYSLHLFSTDKFKKVELSLYLSNNIQDSITERNLLIRTLLNSTKKYNSKRKMQIASENLYSPDIIATNERISELYLTKFVISFYDKKYIEEDLEENAIELLYEILYEINAKEQAFDKISFDLEKSDLKEKKLLYNENNRNIAVEEFYQNFAKNTVLAETHVADLERLEQINEHSLYEFYEKIISESKVDIFVVGDIDFDKTNQLIDKYFSKIKSKKNIEYSEFKHSNSKYQEIVSEKVNLQNISIFGYKLYDLNSKKEKRALTVMNNILGEGVSSRLFDIVREKHSLCYTIFSNYLSADSIITIMTMYSKENYNKLISLIKEIQESLFTNITDDELEKARASIQAKTKMLLNNASFIIRAKYAELYLDMPSLNDYEKELLAVTKEDIYKLKDKMLLDTVYTLGGKDAWCNRFS